MKTLLLTVAAAFALCGAVLAVPPYSPSPGRNPDPRPHVRPHGPQPRPYYPSPYVRPYYPARPYYVFINGRWIIVYPYSPYAPHPYPYGPYTPYWPRM